MDLRTFYEYGSLYFRASFLHTVHNHRLATANTLANTKVQAKRFETTITGELGEPETLNPESFAGTSRAPPGGANSAAGAPARPNRALDRGSGSPWLPQWRPHGKGSCQASAQARHACTGSGQGNTKGIACTCGSSRTLPGTRFRDLDLSVKSLVCFGCGFRPVHLGAWPGGSWLPWRAAPFWLCCCSCLVLKRLPQEWSCISFHVFTCTMGFAPIKWTCTAFF